jgi:hypothetical protein
MLSGASTMQCGRVPGGTGISSSRIASTSPDPSHLKQRNGQTWPAPPHPVQVRNTGTPTGTEQPASACAGDRTTSSVRLSGRSAFGTWRPVKFRAYRSWNASNEGCVCSGSLNSDMGSGAIGSSATPYVIGMLLPGRSSPHSLSSALRREGSESASYASSISWNL